MDYYHYEPPILPSKKAVTGVLMLPPDFKK
jgi:hypothetical protein